MSFAPQIKIAATYMRGGTSKGVFFKLDDLPEAAQKPGTVRDQILLRVIGSPDPGSGKLYLLRGRREEGCGDRI